MINEIAHPNNQFTVDELGEQWGRLLSQAFAQNIVLKKTIDKQDDLIERLREENEQLRERLHYVEAAEQQRIAVEAKTIINDGAGEN